MPTRRPYSWKKRGIHRPSHLLHAFLALGAALQVAVGLGLVVLFFGGFWVALVLSCYVQPV